MQIFSSLIILLGLVSVCLCLITIILGIKLFNLAKSVNKLKSWQDWPAVTKIIWAGLLEFNTPEIPNSEKRHMIIKKILDAKLPQHPMPENWLCEVSAYIDACILFSEKLTDDTNI